MTHIASPTHEVPPRELAETVQCRGWTRLHGLVAQVMLDIPRQLISRRIRASHAAAKAQGVNWAGQHPRSVQAGRLIVSKGVETISSVNIGRHSNAGQS